MRDFINWLQSSAYIKGVSFAIFGGFVRVLTSYKGRLKFKFIISGLLAAIFVGLVCIEIIQYYNLDSKLMGLVCILSGYCHREMVDIITKKFLGRINKENDKL